MLMEDFIKWSSSTNIRLDDHGKHNLPFEKHFPLICNCYKFSFAHRITPSLHDYLEVTYIHRGSGKLFVENKTFDVDEGSLLVIGNSEFHLLQADKNVVMKVICLYFQPEFIYTAGVNELDFEYLYPFYSSGKNFNNIIQLDGNEKNMVISHLNTIISELNNKEKFYKLSAKCSMLALLLSICRHYNEEKKDLYFYNKRKNELNRLKEAFKYLAENFETKITLNEVAQKVFMSESYFCKMFKRFTGCTLTEYIARLRVDQAKQFLLLEDLTVAEIAEKTGFESHSYFDRIFHKITGLSPNEYRSKLKIK